MNAIATSNASFDFDFREEGGKKSSEFLTFAS